MNKLPTYDMLAIVRAGEIEANIFEALKEDPVEGVEAIRQFRIGFGRIITDFDDRWVKMCNGDISELTDWASRMRLVRSVLNELDRYLAVAEPHLFDWNRALKAMGFLNSFRVAAEQVLGMNEELAV